MPEMMEHNDLATEVSLTVDRHLEVLRRGPIADGEVNEWQRLTWRDRSALTEDDLRIHLREHCTGDSFGRWAAAMYAYRSWAPPEYVVDIIREAYESSTPTQKLLGAIHAVGAENATPPPEIAKAKATGAHLYELIAEIVVRPPLSNTTRANIENGLVALRSIGNRIAAQAIFYRLQLVNTGGLDPDALTPLISGELESSKIKVSDKVIDFRQTVTASKTVEVKQDPPVFKTKSISRDHVAVVVVRQIETDSVETFLRSPQSAQLTVDARYLAAELTRHRRWLLQLNRPMRIRMDNRAVLVSSADVTISNEALVVRFWSAQVGSSPLASFGIHRAAERVVDTGSRGHAAATILALLFGSVNRLRKSSSPGDAKLASVAATCHGVEVSAIYRFLGLVRWNSAIDYLRRVDEPPVPSAKAPRREHDVRGTFRTVRGKTYPVKPHRRRS